MNILIVAILSFNNGLLEINWAKGSAWIHASLSHACIYSRHTANDQIYTYESKNRESYYYIYIYNYIHMYTGKSWIMYLSLCTCDHSRYYTYTYTYHVTKMSTHIYNCTLNKVILWSIQYDLFNNCLLNPNVQFKLINMFIITITLWLYHISI